MPGLGDRPGYINRPQQFWLVLSVALLLGLGAYLWLNHVLGEPAVAALLTVTALVLLWIFIGLGRRLQLSRAQRDQAQAWANETQWQMSEVLRKQDIWVEQQVARRVQELQNEIAGLRDREQLLVLQAHHDDLTGLANRNLLTDRFRFAVERAKRSGKFFALLIIDLNGFKSINDNHGHVAGDAVLVATAKRLVGALRASDTVARLGGDEFVLIVESVEDPQELDHIGQKLIDTLAEPITLGNGVVVNNGASVGLALYPDDGADMNTLLQVADQAMYECKGRCASLPAVSCAPAQCGCAAHKVHPHTTAVS